MPVQPLTPDKVRHICSPETFSFKTTAELEPMSTIIGQPRGTKAIEFGINIPNDGYNIFVLGPTGSGRATAIMRYLQAQTKGQKEPCDWVYVHNFSVPHQPRAIDLHAGEGTRLRNDMAQLIADLRRDLPQAFATDSYRQAVEAAQGDFEQAQQAALGQFQQAANAVGFGLVQTAQGLGVVPVANGRQRTQEELSQLPLNEQQQLQETAESLMNHLVNLQDQLYQLEQSTREKIRKIDRDVAAAATKGHFDRLREKYDHHEEVMIYLNEVQQDVLAQIDDFAPQLENEQPIDLRRYEINVLVDNSKVEGAPVIIENNPTYHNLFGRLEYEMQDGILTTHFTNIRCGSLHAANDGYLILDALDVLQQPEAWDSLKRALKSREISMQQLATMNASQVLAKSLSPEPIPLRLKIVMLGTANVFYALFDQDEDFIDLFKVRADFDALMPRNEAHMADYARFVATRCHEDGLHHFEATAVAKVIEFGSRLAEHQQRLSTRFGAITDLIQEASYWCEQAGRATVTADDVRKALSERAYRSNRLEELLHEQILEGTVLIATEGEVVGQINGLSVLDTGDYAFGQPSRITARVFMGDNGVIHIERETDMSGPIHQKGVLTLVGYLGGMYAQNQPLSISASLTFEQQYGGIEGDSASSAELYALLSAISGLPVKQSIAVTGSVNQRGEIQPIGGVNEKIEGFFRICAGRGLTGEQGVVIPRSNVPNLMLDEDVVTAVAEGKFHIWAISTIDEGIELLTGVPAGVPDEEGNFPEGTVHYLAKQRLYQLARDLKAFGEDDDDNHEGSEEEGSIDR